MLIVSIEKWQMDNLGLTPARMWKKLAFYNICFKNKTHLHSKQLLLTTHHTNTLKAELIQKQACINRCTHKNLKC